MIVFCHLLNDRSGSPKVLAAVIASLCAGGRSARLFVGSDGAGLLDEAGLPITRYWYRRGSHRLATVFTYVLSQCFLFFRLLRFADLPRDAVIYVNTLLPFGAAIFGAMTGRKVIYHLHEVSVTPALLRWFLTGIARLTARRLIYVSEFHRTCLPIPAVPATTIYNPLDVDIAHHAIVAPVYRPRRSGVFRVLMLASLRDYKGIPEYVYLASRCEARTDIHFHLVANDDPISIGRYFANKSLPSNLTIHPRTGNPAVHYAMASLVVNLSRPDQWLETFGLTLLEAMAFGIPVIAPPVGGPLELVSDGREGYLVDSRQADDLYQKVNQLVDNEELCLRMSAAALQRASRFSQARFARCLCEALAESGVVLNDCQGGAF